MHWLNSVLIYICKYRVTIGYRVTKVSVFIQMRRVKTTNACNDAQCIALGNAWARIHIHNSYQFKLAIKLNYIHANLLKTTHTFLLHYTISWCWNILNMWFRFALRWFNYQCTKSRRKTGSECIFIRKTIKNQIISSSYVIKSHRKKLFWREFFPTWLKCLIFTDNLFGSEIISSC